MKKVIFTLLFIATNICMFAEGKDNVDTYIAVNQYANQNTFVLIIGNENYKYEQSVPYALNDARIFKLYCEKTLGIPAKHIKCAEDATLNDIYMQLSWLKDVMTTFDGEAKAIIYYSGHGMPDESGKSAYLLPVDGSSTRATSGLNTKVLYKELGGMPSSGTVVFLDACFSGARRDGQMFKTSRGVAVKAPQEPVEGNMVVFSAAQAVETAYPYQEKEHGLFTYFILKQLQEKGGCVTMGELSDYVTKQVSRTSIIENNKKQTPLLTASKSIVTDWKDWALAPQAATDYEKVAPMVNSTTKPENEKGNNSLPTVKMSSSQDPVLPSWFNEETAYCKIGVSAPTKNAANAKSMALINATLSYLRCQQEGETNIKSDVKLYSKQEKDDIALSTEELVNISKTTYKDFHFELLEEYYNTRGEYFVKCGFARSSNALNVLQIKQTTKSFIQGGQKMDVFNAAIEIKLVLNGHNHLCSLTVKTTDDGQFDYMVSVNDTPVIPIKGLAYPAIEGIKPITPGSLLHFSNLECEQSIGLLQLSTCALLPFIPRSGEGTSIITRKTAANSLFYSESFQKCTFQTIKTISKPIPLSFTSLNSTGLKFHISDVDITENEFLLPSDEYLPKIISKSWGWFERDFPNSGLLKLLYINKYFYVQCTDIIALCHSHVCTNCDSEIEISSSDNTVKIEDIGVFWQFSNLPSEKELEKAKKKNDIRTLYGFRVAAKVTEKERSK